VFPSVPVAVFCVSTMLRDMMVSLSDAPRLCRQNQDPMHGPAAFVEFSSKHHSTERAARSHSLHMTVHINLCGIRPALFACSEGFAA
jgi:hypothetical protein